MSRKLVGPVPTSLYVPVALVLKLQKLLAALLLSSVKFWQIGLGGMMKSQFSVTLNSVGHHVSKGAWGRSQMTLPAFRGGKGQ